MKNKKRYFIWYDYKTTMLLFAVIIVGMFTAPIRLITQGVFTLKLWLIAARAMIPYAVCYLAVAFVVTTNLVSINNNKIKASWIQREFALDRVVGITHKKHLYLNYIDKHGKDKKYVVSLFSIKSNRDKYIQIVDEIIKNINQIGNITIEENAQEMLNEMHINRKNHLYPDDSKPLKIRGWLLIWQLYFGFNLIVLGITTVWFAIRTMGWTLYEIRAYHLQFIGLLVVLVLSTLMNLTAYVFSHIRRKWVANAIIITYYLKALLAGGAVLRLALHYAPLYEPGTAQIVYAAVVTFIEGLIIAMLYKRYFTTSIRVKNTYIK